MGFVRIFIYIGLRISRFIKKLLSLSNCRDFSTSTSGTKHCILIMKIKNSNILIIFILLLSTISCSKYNALLKNGTLEQKYQEALVLYDQGKYNRSITLFSNILPNLIGSSREDTILFHIGKAHYLHNNWEMSYQYFDEYRNKFPRSTMASEAEYLHAMSYYNLSLAPEKDQTETRRAISAFNEYLNRYPNLDNRQEIEGKIEELERKLYYKTFVNAALYHKIGQYNSAITALRSALKENPEIPYREEMMYLITRSWYDYAKGSIPSKQLDRYLKTIDAYYNFRNEFESSERFDRSLLSMYAQALEYTKKYGNESKEIQRSMEQIKEMQERIYNNKDKIFSTPDKNERIKLKEENKELKAKIKQDQAILKKDTRELRMNQSETIKKDIARERSESKSVREYKKEKNKEAKQASKVIDTTK